MTQKFDLLTAESLSELTSAQHSPCLSLYQPTHRCGPENQQDPIRFRNLVKELEVSVRQEYPAAEAERLLKPFTALSHDDAFWNHTWEGLAVLSGQDLFRVFRLQRSVAALAVVAGSFHIKPLRRFLQSVTHFQVLGLSLKKIQLFEGNRDAIDEIELAPGVPRTINEALGDELTEPLSTVTSHGGVGGDSSDLHHGHGGKKDEVDSDTERFFRVVGPAVLEHHSKPSGLPLILAALPEHHDLFRKLSHNPYLMTEGLKVNPDVLTITELRERAWQVIQPQYQARLTELTEEFEEARSKGHGNDDLTQVAQAAAQGRVATLLIEADRHIPGRLDGGTGQVEVADLSDPQDDELCEDLGELVEKMGGRVLVMPADQMPSQTGLAATYRY